MTLIIIVATCLISYQCFNDPALRAQLLFQPAAINNRGEWYRFITSGFIHADFRHLLFNMWALYIFGQQAEMLFVDGLYYSDGGVRTSLVAPIFGKPLGPLMYLLFYLAGIVAASSVNYLRHKDNYGYTALGASGGVSAMMWPFILLGPWEWFIFPPLPAIFLGVAYLWYSNRMDQQGGGRVDHSAHLWGAIFGLIAYVLLVVFRRPQLLEIFWMQLQNPKGPSFLGF
ncbi:rhomboid family intramembrane serine protease [Lewinellaceae bacterium SD302]|nr:rhomboid family intramembrane serine protease [Lewinellaceae bacterium SD302]